MHPDDKIKHNIEFKIYSKFTPIAHNIRICVHSGIVTLWGTLKTEIETRFVENAVLLVKGVLGVINNIHTVSISWKDEYDAVLAEKVETALKNEANLNGERLKVRVKDRWVTLDGEVNWTYLVAKAYNAVRSIEGVKGITNLLTSNEKLSFDLVLRKLAPKYKNHDVSELKTQIAEPGIDFGTLEVFLPSWYINKFTGYTTIVSQDLNKVGNLVNRGIPIEAFLN